MSNQTLLRAIEKCPPTQYWRLLIDGNRQKNSGPLGFDQKEPGYLQGMMGGLDFICQSVKDPLSAQYLIDLHDTCIDPVRNILTAESASGVIKVETPFTQGIYDAYKTFGLITQGPCINYTKQGLQELRDKLLQGDTSFCIEKNDMSERVTSENIRSIELDELFEKVNTGQWSVAIINSPKENPVSRKIESIIKTYHKNIENARHDEEKIRAIATCVHELELAHPFPDANCRTLVTLLTNKLLLQNDLPLTLLENPNRFDAYSVDELCTEITRGMEKFKSYTQPSSAEYHDVVEDAPLLYLNNHPALMALWVESQLSQCPHWDHINASEKDRCVKLMTTCLEEVNVDALNSAQIKLLSQNMQEQVQSATYEKGFLSSKKNGTFGLRFHQDFASLGQGLKATVINEKFKSSLSGASSFSQMKQSIQDLKRSRDHEPNEGPSL